MGKAVARKVMITKKSGCQNRQPGCPVGQEKKISPYINVVRD